MYNCSVFSTILETLRLRFFLGISLEPRTSRSHVTRALPSGLRSEVHVCTARPRSRDQMFTARFFCTLKHHNPTFEKKYNFLELFCLVIIEFYLFIYLFILLFIYFIISHNKDYTSITLYKDVARGPQKTTRLVRGGPLVTIILSNRTITILL